MHTDKKHEIYSCLQLKSPCSTPATISKYSVSLSGERTFTLMFL